MTDRMYDALAKIQRLWLPAIATLIATLGRIWNWEFPVNEVTLTITAVDTFLGVVLQIQNASYFEENIIIPKE